MVRRRMSRMQQKAMFAKRKFKITTEVLGTGGKVFRKGSKGVLVEREPFTGRTSAQDVRRIVPFRIVKGKNVSIKGKSIFVNPPQKKAEARALRILKKL